MAAIDPSTDLGKVRLRIADFGDIPILPDSVILQTLTDKNNNVAAASALCAQYILGTLAFSSHKKMAQLEIWGSEVFANYLKFLNLIIKDPYYNGVNPIALVVTDGCESPIIRFQRNFKNNNSLPSSDYVMSETQTPFGDCCGNPLDYIPTVELP